MWTGLANQGGRDGCTYLPTLEHAAMLYVDDTYRNRIVLMFFNFQSIDTYCYSPIT